MRRSASARGRASSASCCATCRMDRRGGSGTTRDTHENFSKERGRGARANAPVACERRKEQKKNSRQNLQGGRGSPFFCETKGFTEERCSSARARARATWRRPGPGYRRPRSEARARGCARDTRPPPRRRTRPRRPLRPRRRRRPSPSSPHTRWRFRRRRAPS